MTDSSALKISTGENREENPKSERNPDGTGKPAKHPSSVALRRVDTKHAKAECNLFSVVSGLSHA